MTGRPTKPAAPKCPGCQSTDAIPYVYGYAGEELWEAQKRGEVVLGGRDVWPGQPALRCRKCGTEFTKDGREAVDFEQRQQAHTYESQPPPAKRTAKKR